jgi:hypothetical protein
MRIITSIHSVCRRALQTPVLLSLLVPVFLFLLATNYAKSHYYRDPTSKFFDPSRAYEPRYSTLRRHEADTFIDVSVTKPFLRSSKNPPFLCAGMLTIARPSGDIYFRTSIGSLLAGLTRYERDMIYLVPFIGHTNASAHPVFTEPWLRNVADLVLTYNNSKFMSHEQYVHIQELEKEREKTKLPDREKHLFDYTQVLKECEDVGAKYVAVVEDDVLALDGWFHRMRKGLQEVERRTNMKGRNGCKLFLRGLDVSCCSNLINNLSLLPETLLRRGTTGLERRRMAEIPTLDTLYYTHHNPRQCGYVPFPPPNARRAEPRHDTPLR